MTMLSDKATVPTSGLNKQMGLLGLDIALLISLVLTLHPGTHIAGGLLLMAGCAIHLAMHARWIKAVILNELENITPVLSSQRRLFLGYVPFGLSLWAERIGYVTACSRLSCFPGITLLFDSNPRSEWADLFRTEYLPSGTAQEMVRCKADRKMICKGNIRA